MGGISSVEVVMRAFPAPPSPPVSPVVILVEGLALEGYIPVTSDVVPLSITTHTVVVANRRAPANTPANWALFSAARGDAASVILEQTQQLPIALPDGYTFVSAVSASVFVNDQAIAVLLGSDALTLSFAIPHSFVGRSVTIFYWDATLNGGLGGWAKLNVVVRYRSQATVAADWLALPLRITYWESTAKFGLGDWIELQLTASYDPAIDWIELPASASKSLLTLMNADGRASVRVSFTGLFVLAAQ
ncbi:MAG: hypothetical protein AAB427_13740 [Chloroflexota bacterium]